MEGCYHLLVRNPGNYEPAPLPNGAAYAGCKPGTITYAISGGSYPDNGCAISNSVNPIVQITNICTGEISSINLSFSTGGGGDILEALLQSGMSQAEIDQTLADIALGLLTPREY